MNDLSKALSDIADIREQMAASRLFRGFGPLVIGLTGVLALCVTALQLIRPETFASGLSIYFTVWIVTAILSLGFILLEMWALSRRHHGRMAFKMVRRVAEGFLPALLAGAILGIVLIGQGSAFAVLLPALWQFMIAIGLLATMGSLHRNIYMVALWYFLCASISLFLLSSGQDLSPLHMGLPFGFGQIFMGLVLAYSFKGDSPQNKEDAHV